MKNPTLGESVHYIIHKNLSTGASKNSL